MKPRAAVLVAGILFFTLLAAAQQSVLTSSAAVPPLIPYTGVARDLNGKAISGTVGVTFLLYKQQDGGSPLWLETQNVQTDPHGNYSVQLGVTMSSGIPTDLFSSGEARWLGVQISGQAEQPRVLLLSVPYALKAADAQTIGGLPPSAFVLAAPSGNGAVASTAAASSSTPPPSGAVTGSGTVNYLPLWDSTSDILSSVIFQSGTGSTAKIGINTATPISTLDVKGGATVRGVLSLPAGGAATATAGKNSQPLNLAASAFSSTTSTTVNQTFQWKAEPAGNNTSTPSGTLNLLFGEGTSAPTETGLKVANNGQITFAAGQTFPGAGTGTITGVTAGTDLTGGGTTGNVTLNLDTTKVAQLTGGNSFTGNQTVNGNVSAAQLISTIAQGTAPLSVTSTTQVPNLNASLLDGLSASAFQVAGSYATLGGNFFSASQVINSGDLIVVSGDLDLPQSSGTAGLITMGRQPFAHACCTAAQDNLFLGVNAGNLTTTGATNTAEGFEAMFKNTSGCCNVANGTQALFSNTQGCCNVADGQAALISNTTGTNNTADGYQAMYSNTTGAFNTALGIDALLWNTTGSGNIGIGNAAGNPSNHGAFTGSNNTFIGGIANTGTQLALNNASAIGAYAQVTESNAMVLGSTAGINGAPATVNVGIGTTAPAFTLDVHGTGNFTGPISFASGQTFPGTIAGVTTAAGSGLTGGGTSGTLNLSLTNTCAATQVLQWTGSAWACSAAGSGTITGVTAGNDLTGGGTSGVVTLNLDTTQVPLLASGNTFTANQTIFGGSLAIINNNTYQPMLVQSSSTFGTWLELANTSTNGQTWNILSAGGGNAEGAGNLGITNLHGGTIWLEGPIHGTGTLRVDGPTSAGGVAASFGGNGDFAIDAPGTPGGRLVVKDTSGFVGINDTAPVHPLSVVDTKTAVAIEGSTEYAGEAYGISGIATDTINETAGIRGVNFSTNYESAAVLADNNGSGGNLFLGRASGTHEFRVDTSGNVYASQYLTSGADFAESFAVVGARSLYGAGDLLVIDEKSDRRLALASQPYSSLVAGVYATKPGVLASPHRMDDPQLAKEIPLAVVGIVPCKVTTENGPIARGDLLVTSSTPGYAMKGTDRSRMLGAVVGKALEPLASGRGTIQVLVTLQ
jgi:hypothetical protein